MRHELRAFGGFERAHLDFSGSVRSGVHKNHRACGGNWFCEFGCELMTHEGGDAGQGQLGDCGGHLCSHAVIAAQRVAIADDQKVAIGSLTGIISHPGRLNHLP